MAMNLPFILGLSVRNWLIQSALFIYSAKAKADGFPHGIAEITLIGH
jgi:hypothetical protein